MPHISKGIHLLPASRPLVNNAGKSGQTSFGSTAIAPKTDGPPAVPLAVASSSNLSHIHPEKPFQSFFGTPLHDYVRQTTQRVCVSFQWFINTGFIFTIVLIYRTITKLFL